MQRLHLGRAHRSASKEIGTAADAAVESDRAHSRAVKAHQEWAGRRDDLAVDLHREIADFRRAWRDLHAVKRVELSLGLSGKTPRRTSDLIAWTHAVLVFWGDGEGFFTHDFDKKGFAARIARARKLVAELEAAYDAAGKANLTRASAWDNRRKAIEKSESVLQENARIVESFLSRTGRRDLVVKVRGKHPRGRPRKDDPPRSKPKPKPAAVAVVPQGRVLLSWFERAARKTGRLFHRDPEERQDLHRAA